MSKAETETASLRVRESTRESDDTIVVKRTPTERRDDARAKSTKEKANEGERRRRRTPTKENADHGGTRRSDEGATKAKARAKRRDEATEGAEPDDVETAGDPVEQGTPEDEA